MALYHSWGPANVDTLLTTTRELILQGKEFLNDAIFSKATLLKHLNEKSKVTKQGGNGILVPLMFGKNNTFKAYSGDDVFDTTGQEGLTMAFFNWKNYGGTIKYTGEEIRQNAGEKLTDLAKAKIKQASMSAKDKLNSDFFATSQATKAVSCLPVLVDASSTVGSIASNTYSWWQANVVSTVGSFAANGLDKLRDVRDDAALIGQEGGSLPDLYLTTQLIKELYEASQLPAYRYGPKDKADAGHQEMGFSGGTVDMDPNVASGELYALPTENLEFVCHAQAQWDIGPFQRPVAQDIYVAQMIWMGNLVTNNRRRLAKLTGITA
jgi:hypothetical protein